ncbi:recombinase family protein [Propionivibrio sp.]|uniref:recombinase family protein n=1 Tax=Propionivibrio sp. TaxID=2212460 RepID=UPI00262D0643|nr:recombinase family protein [Propionivibrio sp.]
MNPDTQSTRVFSYRRFSSGRQARGTSLERQTRLAQVWCNEHGLVLDESLSLSDLGVSAFKGDNANYGALGAFMAAIEAGKVPKGSILLVESLDRLSRATLPEAVDLLTKIVKKGVRVVSMVDNKEWNSETIKETVSFMLSVLLFSRAHEESSTKAKRVSAAFQTKRQAGLPVVSKMHGSGWMQPKADKSGWELIPDKAESVRQVFEHAASGLGGVAIARIATEEGWAMPWRQRTNTKGWEHTGISRLLRDRRVLGEWQPMRMVEGTLTPDGDPVQNYFPAAVPEELWHRVQVALKGRTGPKRLRGINADVFAGLFYCKCGERMERKAPTTRGNSRYYCIGSKAGRSKCLSISELAIVNTVLSNLGRFEEDAFRDDAISEAIRERINIAEERAADATSRADRIILAIEECGNSTLLLQRLVAIEAEADKAKSELEAAREELATVPKIGGCFGDNLVDNALIWIGDKSKTEERFKLSDALRRVIKRIEFHDDAVMIYQVSGVGIAQNIPREFLGRARRKDAGMSREEIAAKKKAT